MGGEVERREKPWSVYDRYGEMNFGKVDFVSAAH